MKISITLPSVYPDSLQKALDNIVATTKSADYEIVVVSPFEVRHPRVTWIREDRPRGTCAALAEAFRHATGDFVMALTDHTALAENWDNDCLVSFEAREQNRKLFCLGLHQSTRVVCTTFGIYYPLFPFARRATFETVGYFSDAYQAHFGDSDLALRIWSAGGRCEFTRRPLIIHYTTKDRDHGPTRKLTSYEQDKAVLVERWAGRYGIGWDTAIGTNFNSDIDPLTQIAFVRDHTIFFNDPKFNDIRMNMQVNFTRWKGKLELDES